LNQSYRWINASTRNASCKGDSEHQSESNTKSVDNEVFGSILKFDAEDDVYKDEGANHFRNEKGVIHTSSIAFVICVDVNIIWTQNGNSREYSGEPGLVTVVHFEISAILLVCMLDHKC